MDIKFTIGESKIPPGMKPVLISDTKDLVHVPNCPVCESKLDEVLKLRASDSDVYFGRGYCQNCGYFGVSQTYSPEWIDNYYRDTWTNNDGMMEHEMSTDFINEITYKYISKYVPDKNAAILDAGAGYGSGVRGLVTRGYSNVQALELSKRRVEVLKKRYGIKVDSLALQDLQDSKILDTKFDAIYLWHVFEHLSCLVECMQAISDSIKDDGYLFIAVPEFQGEHFANLLNMHVHMHSFQPFTLDYFLSKYGFEKVESCTSNTGSGIRAIYKKTSGFNLEGNLELLPSKQQIRDLYHDKVFKDWQLMYLVHQPEWTRRKVLLSFHYNSSFAGSCLHKYPLNFIDAFVYKFWAKADTDVQLNRTFLNRVRNKVARVMSKYLAVPEGSMLFESIDGIPSDLYKFRLIYDTTDLMSLEFFFKSDEVKLWQE